MWGKSGENKISLSSARSVLAVSNQQFEIFPLVIDTSGKFLSLEDSRRVLNNDYVAHVTESTDLNKLPTDVFDVVFPLLHGPYGEDGTIQGLLNF